MTCYKMVHFVLIGLGILLVHMQFLFLGIFHRFIGSLGGVISGTSLIQMPMIQKP